MNRRELLKALGLTGIAIVSGHYSKSSLIFGRNEDSDLKNWAWVTTDIDKSLDDWKRDFANMREAGITAIIPEVYNGRFAFYASKHLPVKSEWLERILPAAKSEDLEVHAWIWAMICNIENIYKEHPEWYIVNGRGESILQKPAYAEWYRFLCPSRPEPLEFITETVRELAAYGQLDGIHLDYIRYPEVIIAESLQKKYGIVQDREYPEYDYCYCEECRKAFKDKTGLDPLEFKDPALNSEWKQYRYDTISNFVNNKVVPVAGKYNKMLTAAVFPPDIRINVRQQWPDWNIDAFLPMLYNSFYNKGTDWIKEQTEKGRQLISKTQPLYSGLFVPQLSPDELNQAVDASISGGAKGIVLFALHSMTDEKWRSFKKVLSEY